MNTFNNLVAVAVFVSFSSPLGSFRSGTMAQDVQEGVVPLECSPSDSDGYDFMVQPVLGFTLHWYLSPDLEEASFRAVLNAELPGWLAIGFSADGGMVGSDAVVGVPSQGTALEYDLDSIFAEFIQPSPFQEITDVFVEKVSGTTSLGFTRPANPVGIGKLSLLTTAGESSIFLWAFGPEETLSYHFEGRGAISLDLLCSTFADDDESTRAPTPSPVVVFSSSPTSAPTGVDIDTFGQSQYVVDERDSSGSKHTIPRPRTLAGRAHVFKLGGWVGSVGVLIGLAVGLVSAAMAG